MKMLRQVLRSTTMPITLDEIENHLRRASNEDDELVKNYILAASAYCENFMGLSLIDQTWDFYTDDFPIDGDILGIPRGPLIEVSEVFYRDIGGANVELTGFSTDLTGSSIYLPVSTTWPATDGISAAVRVRFRAGFVDEQGSPEADGAIPEDIKIAIMQIVGTMYQNRETIVIGANPTVIPWGAEQIMRMHRIEMSLA